MAWRKQQRAVQAIDDDGVGGRELPGRKLRLHDLEALCHPVDLLTIESSMQIRTARRSAPGSSGPYGPGRKQTLQSYGIETAADLNSAAITWVPGFGAKMADKLLAWRGSLEKRFRFDPAKAIDPREIMGVEQEVLVERRRREERFRLAFVGSNRPTHKSLRRAST
jgi:DNA-binding helix-hairpin-helix protein with protein kinase domain